MNVPNRPHSVPVNTPPLGNLHNLDLKPLDGEVNQQLNHIEILIQKYAEKKINQMSLQFQSEISKIRADITKLNEEINTVIDTEAKKLSEKVNASADIPIKSNSSGNAYEVNPKSSHLEASAIKQKLQDSADKLDHFLFECLKLEAAKYGGTISKDIQNYGIKDQKQLFEIAKIAAAHDGLNTSRYIKNYGIEDEEKRFEIAKIAISSTLLFPKKTAAIFTAPFEALECYPPEIYEQYPSVQLLSYGKDLTSDEIRQYAGKGPFPKGLESIINNICDEKETFVRTPLTKLLGIFLLKWSIDSTPNSDIERVMPIIQELFSFREPEYRSTLAPRILQFLQDPRSIDLWELLFNKTTQKGGASQQKKASSFTALISMSLACFIPENFVNNISQVISHYDFKYTAKRNPFIKSLEMIRNQGSFSEKQKGLLILNLVFGPPPFNVKSVIENANRISDLLVFGQAEALKEWDPSLGLDPLINKHLNEQMGLDGIENCADKFWNIFGKFRRKDALLTYTAGLQRLGDEEEKNLHINCLKIFTREVLEGTFLVSRYMNNPHLDIVFGGPLGKQLKNEWVKGARYVDAFQPEAIMAQRQGNAFNPLSFFETKILQEKHLPHDDYSDLVSVLNDPEKAEAVKKSLQERLTEKESPENKTTKKKDNFQLQLINLIHSSRPLEDKELFEKLEDLLRRFNKIYLNRAEQPPELMTDLQEIVEALKSSKENRQLTQYAGWEVVDTDDPCDLLLLGTEVPGSCQRIDGDPNLNKCLLSYLMDGKNRAIVVKNKSGNIVARAILRILWDDVKKEPVLFQERSYPLVLDPLVERALNESFKRRAREIGLPLLSGKRTISRYPNRVRSLGDVAPSEYVDADGIGLVQGPWSLYWTYLVQDFPEQAQRLETP
jgi:hypothetical protein